MSSRRPWLLLAVVALLALLCVSQAQDNSETALMESESSSFADAASQLSQQLYAGGEMDAESESEMEAEDDAMALAELHSAVEAESGDDDSSSLMEAESEMARRRRRRRRRRRVAVHTTVKHIAGTPAPKPVKAQAIPPGKECVRWGNGPGHWKTAPAKVIKKVVVKKKRRGLLARLRRNVVIAKGRKQKKRAKKALKKVLKRIKKAKKRAAKAKKKAMKKAGKARAKAIKRAKKAAKKAVKRAIKAARKANKAARRPHKPAKKPKRVHKIAKKIHRAVKKAHKAVRRVNKPHRAPRAAPRAAPRRHAPRPAARAAPRRAAPRPAARAAPRRAAPRPAARAAPRPAARAAPRRAAPRPARAAPRAAARGRGRRRFFLQTGEQTTSHSESDAAQAAEASFLELSTQMDQELQAEEEVAAEIEAEAEEDSSLLEAEAEVDTERRRRRRRAIFRPARRVVRVHTTTVGGGRTWVPGPRICLEWRSKAVAAQPRIDAPRPKPKPIAPPAKAKKPVPWCKAHLWQKTGNQEQRLQYAAKCEKARPAGVAKPPSDAQKRAKWCKANVAMKKSVSKAGYFYKKCGGAPPKPKPIPLPPRVPPPPPKKKPEDRAKWCANMKYMLKTSKRAFYCSKCGSVCAEETTKAPKKAVEKVKKERKAVQKKVQEAKKAVQKAQKQIKAAKTPKAKKAAQKVLKRAQQAQKKAAKKEKASRKLEQNLAKAPMVDPSTTAPRRPASVSKAPKGDRSQWCSQNQFMRYGRHFEYYYTKCYGKPERPEPLQAPEGIADPPAKDQRKAWCDEYNWMRAHHPQHSMYFYQECSDLVEATPIRPTPTCPAWVGAVNNDNRAFKCHDLLWMRTNKKLTPCYCSHCSCPADAKPFEKPETVMQPPPRRSDRAEWCGQYKYLRWGSDEPYYCDTCGCSLPRGNVPHPLAPIPQLPTDPKLKHSWCEEFQHLRFITKALTTDAIFFYWQCGAKPLVMPEKPEGVVAPPPPPKRAEWCAQYKQMANSDHKDFYCAHCGSTGACQLEPPPPPFTKPMSADWCDTYRFMIDGPSRDYYYSKCGGKPEAKPLGLGSLPEPQEVTINPPTDPKQHQVHVHVNVAAPAGVKSNEGLKAMVARVTRKNEAAAAKMDDILKKLRSQDCSGGDCLPKTHKAMEQWQADWILETMETGKVVP